MDDSKDLSTWERGAPAPQFLSELLERQSGAGAPRSRERMTSFLQDLVSERNLEGDGGSLFLPIDGIKKPGNHAGLLQICAD